jgi:cytochrome c
MSPRLPAATAACALILAGTALAQSTSEPASKGVYTKAQATRGAALYEAECARCHGGAMEGIDVAPPLSGARFLSNWTGQPISALATRIRTTMPLDEPGKLGQAASADLVAALLDANGYPAGEVELSPKSTAPIDATP